MLTNKLFWLLWILTFLALAIYIVANSALTLILLSLSTLFLTALLYFKTERRADAFDKLQISLDKIKLDPLNAEIKKLREEQTAALLKIFNLEMELNRQREEDEKKYREIVRKILEVDNELKEKYELLGKAILKLSKDMSK